MKWSMDWSGQLFTYCERSAYRWGTHSRYRDLCADPILRNGAGNACALACLQRGYGLFPARRGDALRRSS